MKLLRILVLLAGTTFAVTPPASAEDLASRVKAKLGTEQILGFALWGVSTETNPLAVVISSSPVEGSGGQPIAIGSQLRVFRDTGSTVHMISKVDPKAAPLSQFLVREVDGLMVTTWVTASAFRTIVLQYVPSEKRVRVLLEVGSKGLPEILYPFTHGNILALTIQDYRPGTIGLPSADTPTTVYLFNETGDHTETHTTWSARFSPLR